CRAASLLAGQFPCPLPMMLRDRARTSASSLLRVAKGKIGFVSQSTRRSGRQLQRVVHLDEAHNPRNESLVSAFPGAGHAAEYRRVLARARTLSGAKLPGERARSRTSGERKRRHLPAYA